MFVMKGGVGLRKSNSLILVVVIVMFLLVSIPLNYLSIIEEQIASSEGNSKYTPSTIVWSDNFDDENIDDWEVFGVYREPDPDEVIAGSFSVEGGILRATGGNWTYMGFNSSVAYGTWSFDIDVQDMVNDDHFPVWFVSSQFNDDWLTSIAGTRIGLVFNTYEEGTYGLIQLARISDANTAVMGAWESDNLNGWKHIIVTREPDGMFYVYIDGVLLIEGLDIVVRTSERFYFVSPINPGLDNVSVSDSIDFDLASPRWTDGPEDQQLMVGQDFRYDLNATDSSELDEWSVNDTVHLDVTSDGVI